jgi:hypothetical protein
VETPHKHHYSPAFYLKEWTGADSRLCEYSRLICACPKVNGRIRTRCTFPDGTGYEIDLYRVEGLPETEAHSVETVFMGMVDTDAKRALDKIISGDTTPWDSKMRSAWTRFILSLVFRNPEAVHLIETVMSEIWKTATADLQVDYEKLRQPTDPLTLEEFVVPSRAAPGKAALLMLQQIIDNDRLGPTIFDMHWVSVSVAESKLFLLTSDRPLDMPHGLGNKEKAYITLPVAPRMLFVAAYDDTWARRLQAANPSEVIKVMNLGVVSRARKYVWGIDDGQRRFVENHMSKSPDRPIITEEQKAAAIKSTLLDVRERLEAIKGRKAASFITER